VTTRRLAAILAADVVGFSRLVGEDETGTLAALKEIRKGIVNPVLAEHGGRIFKLMGDGLLAEFPSAVQALQAAISMQQRLHERNSEATSEKPIQVRVGIHQGDVVVEGTDLLGDGVNIAARLEALAEPGGICISGRVHEDAAGKIALDAQDIGEQSLKNIARPVRAYRVSLGSAPADHRRGEPAQRPALPLPDKPSIAVLPFQNMSSDPEQEHFADGIVEDVITALSKLRWFFVIARNSTFAYKGTTPDVRQVARDLGVQYVVEGSVRKIGERLRITAQLCDAMSGNHIWAERYDRGVEDVFAVQDEIVENIAASIEPQLYATEYVRIQSHQPDSLDAWGCVARAQWHLSRLTAEGNENAKQILERAVALSPSYAKARSLLAFALVRRVWFGTAPLDASVPIAREQVKAALLLDESDPWAFLADGLVNCLERKFTDSVAAFRAAIALNPNFAMAHGYIALPLAMSGNTAAALAALERALRISPLDPYNVAFLHFASIAHFATEEYRQSIEFDRRALRERPDFVIALRFIAASHAMLGEIHDARAAVAELLRLQPSCTISYIDSLPRFARAADQQRFIEALRKAGLPE
jgi:TolB-like protein/class 3 adenylate cyclase